MSEPNERTLCSICGLPLPQGELAQRCPHCLLNLAFGEDPDGAAAARGDGVKPDGVHPRYFGDFELIEQIAQGGMGAVWKARQLSIHRFVALKMIHAGHLASAEARIRFCAEIEATARLDHPHIVPLFETGEQNGVHYFTMKLLTGGDLATRRADIGMPAPGSVSLDTRKLRERQAQIAQLLARIARAVQYAHLRGILHRDLKPSNILLDDEGQPHVTDFGLAKLLTRESGFTFTQSVLGSPNYMAPEQAAGKTSELTTATDVYGLGAIFYELLTGRPPFQAASPIATLRQVLDQPPAPPRRLNPAIDRDLETICLKCLEKSPAARYSSAEAMAEDLERWIEKRPIHARRAGAFERCWRWCQREPALATAVAGCAALLLAVPVGSAIAAFRIRQAERKATAALRDSLVNQARSLRLASEIGHRAEGLRLLREACQLGGPADFQQRARDELLATLVRTDMQFSNLPALHFARDPALNVADARFTRLASLVASNTVLVQSLETGRELVRLSTGPEPVTLLEQFSHDGRFLGLRDADGMSIWDTDTGQRCFATNGAQRVFCFAPDRSHLVLEEWNYTATVLELPSLRVIRQLTGSAPAAKGRAQGWSAIAISPEEQTLAVARGRDRVIEWIDMETGASVRRATNRAPVVALAWSPDGEKLAAALSNGRVPVFGPRRGKMFDLPAMPAAARSLAFNSDGSLL
ncbi:MAG: serine/threonine-protein kinase, partial [Verrucomicrobiales bacterium]|nr:serine/threonine-protein kinase [Verrucomicrobiales bacterium]